VYFHSVLSASVLNLVLKHVLVLDIQPICAEYGLETFIAPTKEIRVLAHHLIGPEYGLETKLARTEEIRVLTLDLPPISAVYGLET
jgi:hypothetical protein